MNCRAARKFVTNSYAVALGAWGAGTLAVWVGLLSGAFFVVALGAAVLVFFGIFVRLVIARPIENEIKKMRKAGRLRPLETVPEVDAFAPQSIFSPFFRPPRLTLA